MEPPPALLALQFSLDQGGLDLTSILALACIILLLLGSAAMSASEVALFSLGPTQLRDLKERGGQSGQRVIDLLARPRRLLATILVTNNFVNVGSNLSMIGSSASPIVPSA